MALSIIRDGIQPLQQLSFVMKRGMKLQPAPVTISMIMVVGMMLGVVSVLSFMNTGYAATAAAACTNPSFSTTKADEGRTFGDYYVHNNMWNASSYSVSQKLDACSAQQWNVTVTADNSKGDGAVKTYPNVHKDYHNWSTGAEPTIDSVGSLSSSFAASSPHGAGQIYNVAYDIWLNGVPGNREIMIWTDNWKQTPAGSKISTVQISGQTWEFWASSDNHILTFVAPQALSSGTLDLKAFLDWLSTQKRIPANSTLGQIDYGVEVVSTNGQPATFAFTNFSIGGSTQSPAVPTQTQTTTETNTTSPASQNAVSDESAAANQDESDSETNSSVQKESANSLPSTGPETIISGLLGSSALAYAGVSYIRSRKLL